VGCGVVVVRFQAGVLYATTRHVPKGDIVELNIILSLIHLPTNHLFAIKHASNSPISSNPPWFAQLRQGVGHRRASNAWIIQLARQSRDERYEAGKQSTTGSVSGSHAHVSILVDITFGNQTLPLVFNTGSTVFEVNFFSLHNHSRGIQLL
jgi:hypothetical protein